MIRHRLCVDVVISAVEISHGHRNVVVSKGSRINFANCGSSMIGGAKHGSLKCADASPMDLATQ